MEPQEHGLSEPNISSGQQNPMAWWEPPVEPSDQSIVTGQQAPTSQAVPTDGNPQSPLGVASSAPLRAHDSDLVEKEWVEAAKKIMEQYKSDPYNKNRALTLLRADYMKKRYNKDIKIPEN